MSVKERREWFCVAAFALVGGIACIGFTFWHPLIAVMVFAFGFQLGCAVTNADHANQRGCRD